MIISSRRLEKQSISFSGAWPRPPDRLTNGLALMAAEIVHDHDVAGLKNGRQLLFGIAKKHAPLIGPLKTQGAVSRSKRSAPMKVSVRQWPCGA